MLLNRRSGWTSANESGSALVVVIGVMAVGLILTALALNSVVYGLGYTTATRAGVQSQGSAEAGVAWARAGLFPDATTHLNNCATQPVPAKYVSTTAPAFRALVEQYDATGWHTGCPTTTTTKVRITSTGDAQAQGVAGQTVGNTSKVEAVVKWLVPGPVPSGVGMYLYAGGTVEANSILDLSESTSAGLMIKNGNFFCDKNNSVINGSVLITGNLTFNKTCSVNGSAWVTGTAALGSGSIARDLTAGSVTPNPPGSSVGGTYTKITGATVMPEIPKWAEVGYAPDAWRDITGLPYEVKPLPGCALPNGTLGGTVLGNPVIINALACPNGPTASNGTTVQLTSDVVIFGEKFGWDGVNSLSFASSSTAAHRIWFITPDYTVGNTPSCDSVAAPAGHAQGNFTVKNGFLISAPIEAFLYTPCAFEGKNGFTWDGQLYAGQQSFIQNNPSLTFSPMGIAGVDLSTGDSAPPINYPKPGTVVSIRDVTGP